MRPQIKRSKTRMFWITGEVSFSAAFDKQGLFLESLYTQSDFPYERHILARGGQNGDQNSLFPT